jgi:hypothetical protein
MRASGAWATRIEKGVRIRGDDTLKIATMAAVLGFFWAAVPALGQVEPALGSEIRLDQQETQRWRVGLTISALSGPVSGMSATVPVPTDWPEQTVRIVEEDISPSVQRVSYRTIAKGVKQMVIRIPKLARGETASALVTFEVTKHTILPPLDPSQLRVPKKIPRDVRRYLAPSPYIEVRDKRIRSLARELTADQKEGWETVETIYDWVRKNIEYKNGKLKGAVAALRDGDGDCEELTSLFIALCRANKIPARTVWIPRHCYPEFYLEDGQGNGHWLPCQIAGGREFGGMHEFKPILQKGDNFKVPEKKKPQRYVAEFLTGQQMKNGKPTVRFVRELLPGS